MSVFDGSVGVIRLAIAKHKQIVAYKDGRKRMFCPHILGTNKDGEWCVLGWTFYEDPPTKLASEGMWRCFELKDLTSVAGKDGEWWRGYYSGKGEQSCVATIDTAIDAAHSAVLRGTFASNIRPRNPLRRGR